MTPEMPENAFDAEPEPQKLSEISRLTGVFFEPTKAFTDIAERPRWFVPMLLVILATVAFYVTYGQRNGWRSFVEEQMQSNARMAQQMGQLSPEKREQTINLQAKIIMPITYYVGPVIGMPIGNLFASLVLLGVASGIMSAGVKFKQIFAIGCYAGLTGIISKILGIVVMFLKSPDRFNLMNPLAFNPAAFMDPKTTSKFLYTIASGCDLFIFWGMLLTAIGLKAAAGKRLSFGGALFAVALPWAFFLLIGASIAGAFS
jgi:hypothetical protein